MSESKTVKLEFTDFRKKLEQTIEELWNREAVGLNITSHHDKSASARVSSTMSPLERWRGCPKPTGGGGIP